MEKTIVRPSRKQLAVKNGTYDIGITIHKLIERYGNVCYLCQKEVDFDKNSIHPLYPNIEHVIPISRGGTHSWDNVKVACRGCNVHKSSMMLEEYLEKIGKVTKVEEESEFPQFPEFPGFEETQKRFEEYARNLEAQIENTNREIQIEKQLRKSKPQVEQQKPKKKNWLKKLLSILI